MNCYICNPFDGHTLPDGLNKDNTLFYPESGMTYHQLHTTSRPRDYHIMTDSPNLVGLYSRHEVFYWKDSEWHEADFQTYGCSLDLITARLWGIRCSIPRAVLDGRVTNVMGCPLK